MVQPQFSRCKGRILLEPKNMGPHVHELWLVNTRAHVLRHVSLNVGES